MLWPEIGYFRIPEAYFLPFPGSDPKFSIFELLKPIFNLFGARARNSLFSSSCCPFSAFSGLGPEIKYFRTPETHFQPIRGSAPKRYIYLYIYIYTYIYIYINSRFSNSRGPFSAFSGLGPEIRYFRAPEAQFRLFRGSGQKFAIFQLLRLFFGLFGALARNSLFSRS